MKAVVAAFNQEKALVGAFSVITNLRMELFQALDYTMICIQINRMFYTDPLLNLAGVRAVVAGLGRGGAEEERHRNIYRPNNKLGYTPCRDMDGADKMVNK